MQGMSLVIISAPRNQTKLGSHDRGGGECKYVSVTRLRQPLMLHLYPWSLMPGSPDECGHSLACCVGMVSRYFLEAHLRSRQRDIVPYLLLGAGVGVASLWKKSH